MTYIIIPSRDLSQNIIDVVRQTSIDTVRKSIDKTLAVLKYDGQKPQILVPYEDYTHRQILIQMRKPQWTPPPPSL